MAASGEVPMLSEAPAARRLGAALTVSVLTHAFALGLLLRAATARVEPDQVLIEVMLVGAGSGGTGEAGAGEAPALQGRDLSTALPATENAAAEATAPAPAVRPRTVERSNSIARRRPTLELLPVAAMLREKTARSSRILDDLVDGDGNGSALADAGSDANGSALAGAGSGGSALALAASGGNGAGSGRGGDGSARITYATNPLPPYPLVARRRGMEGLVMLEVVVAPDGTASDVRISRSSGFGLLDDAALNTVRRRWRFVPARRAGMPVAGLVTVPIRFRLEDAQA